MTAGAKDSKRKFNQQPQSKCLQIFPCGICCILTGGTSILDVTSVKKPSRLCTYVQTCLTQISQKETSVVERSYKMLLSFLTSLPSHQLSQTETLCVRAQERCLKITLVSAYAQITFSECSWKLWHTQHWKETSFRLQTRNKNRKRNTKKVQCLNQHQSTDSAQT